MKLLGRKASFLALGFTMASGVVFAQDAPAPTPDTPAERPADLEVPMQTRANISAGDMMSKTAEYVHAMQTVLRRAVQLQQVARKFKDVIKLNCVNDKLLQVKQLINIAESAHTNLQEAIEAKDDDGRYHEFSRITIVSQQVTVLGTEAENCVGDDLTFLGPTQVVVEAPDEPEDPTLGDKPQIPDVEPPPIASPFA